MRADSQSWKYVAISLCEFWLGGKALSGMNSEGKMYVGFPRVPGIFLGSLRGTRARSGSRAARIAGWKTSKIFRAVRSFRTALFHVMDFFFFEILPPGGYAFGWCTMPMRRISSA